MQYEYAEGPWVETDAKLVIRKSDLDPDLLAQTLSVAPTSLSREGVWAFAVQARLPGGVDEQVRELLRKIEPLASSIATLTAQGYEAAISISGFVGNGSTFTLSPDVVSRAAALNIPLVVSPSNSDR